MKELFLLRVLSIPLVQGLVNWKVRDIFKLYLLISMLKMPIMREIVLIGKSCVKAILLSQALENQYDLAELADMNRELGQILDLEPEAYLDIFKQSIIEKISGVLYE